MNLTFQRISASQSTRTFPILPLPKLWRSMVYALLEGSSQALGIRRDDLDGTFYTHTRSEPPAIVLFDNVPGGAGHIKRIAEELVPVFENAYQRVDSSCCGAETSC